MIFALFLLLIAVQGSKFNFDFVNEELNREMEQLKSLCPTVINTLLPARPIGEPYEQPTIQYTTNPGPINPVKAGNVYDAFPARMMVEKFRIIGDGSREVSPIQFPPQNPCYKRDPSNPLIYHSFLPEVISPAGKSDCVLSSQPPTEQLFQSSSSEPPRINPLKRPTTEVAASPTIEIESVTDHQDFLIYLEEELAGYKFRSIARREQAIKVITFIANNDYDGYLGNLDAFKTIFSFKCKILAKRGTRALPSYIVRFGATKFMQIVNELEPYRFDWKNLINDYLHLIKTKSLSIVLNILKGSCHIPEAYLTTISEAIRTKYPRMNFSDNYAFETALCDSKMTEEASNVIRNRSIKEQLDHSKLLMLRGLLLPNHKLSDVFFKGFLCFPLKYPEYFMTFDNFLKFHVAKIAVIHEDVDALVKIIELDANVLLLSDNELNLFDIVVNENKKATIPLLLTVIPEFAFAPKPDDGISLYESLVIADNLEMIRAFENAGLSAEDKVINGKNPIQLAYEHGSTYILVHFYEKHGIQAIFGHLIEIYGSPSEVLKAVPAKFEPFFREVISTKLASKNK